ncbi:MAG: tRNA (adenosine(37)-N6)-dimethylallyltransferase MiaA [Eubacterium sp.]|nr:tRNA (adenosine(37)-N6)-dimethylallyltransferase MiaA [Eubacterium sp.]
MTDTENNRRIIAVAGPTAAGKTEFAIEIAKTFNGEVVSCDSMQLYRYMDIGSAKPTPEQIAEVPHHLVDMIDPREEFSVAKYQNLAKKAIEDIFARGKRPVICGGTGLYLESLIFDLDFAAEPESEHARDKYYEIAEQEGPETLYSILSEKDPEAAARIHPNNIKRVVRALEAFDSGRPIEDINTAPQKTEDYEVTLIGISRDREELYDRINRRVDKLMDLGLLEEVKSLVDMGLGFDDISMKGIGYKELIGYLNKEYDLDEAVRLIKRNTRHLAKRQMTWFRRYKDMNWFNVSEYNDEHECMEDIKSFLTPLFTR